MLDGILATVSNAASEMLVRATLTSPHRFNDESWARTLLEIGDGTYPQNDNGKCYLPHQCTFIEPSDDFDTASTVIAPLHRQVDKYNEKIMSVFPGIDVILKAKNVVNTNAQLRYLNS